VLLNINNLDKNIDSVSVLTQIARNMAKKGKAQGNTLDVHDDFGGEVYTSKHFVYGSLIVQCWRQFIEIKEAEQKAVDNERDLQGGLYTESHGSAGWGGVAQNKMRSSNDTLQTIQ